MFSGRGIIEEVYIINMYHARDNKTRLDSLLMKYVLDYIRDMLEVALNIEIKTQEKKS